MLKIVATSLALLGSTTAFAGKPAQPALHAVADPFGIHAFTRSIAIAWGGVLSVPKQQTLAEQALHALTLTPGKRSFGPVDDQVLHAAIHKIAAEYPGARIDFAPPGLSETITNKDKAYVANHTDVAVTPNGVIRLSVTQGDQHVTREVKTAAGGTRLANKPSEQVTRWALPIVERALKKARLAHPEAVNVLRDGGKPIGPNGEIPLRISYPYRDPRGQFNVTVTTTANGTRVGDLTK